MLDLCTTMMILFSTPQKVPADIQKCNLVRHCQASLLCFAPEAHTRPVYHHEDSISHSAKIARRLRKMYLVAPKAVVQNLNTHRGVILTRRGVIILLAVSIAGVIPQCRGVIILPDFYRWSNLASCFENILLLHYRVPTR